MISVSFKQQNKVQLLCCLTGLDQGKINTLQEIRCVFMMF